MNVSSIVIQCNPRHYDNVKEWCEKSGICEYHFGEKEKGKMIVTIEGADVSEEIEKLKQLQVAPYVISAEMMMTYQEDMLDEEMKRLEESNPVPEWLNDENVKAEDIVYKGDLKKKHI
jgi:nitrate reductase NapD